MINLNKVEPVDQINEDDAKAKTVLIEPSADFTKETIRNLYRSTGGYCSICGRQTIARDPETKKYLCNGEAAHICGKNRTAARHDELKTKEELKSFENGIWVCRNCHYEIDRNYSKYPSEDLKEMKMNAEKRSYLLYMKNIDMIETTDYQKFTISKFNEFQKCLIHYALTKGYNKTTFDLQEYDYWDFEDEIFKIYGKRVPFIKKSRDVNWFEYWDKFIKFEFGSVSEASFSINSEILHLIVVRDYSHLTEDSDIVTLFDKIFDNIKLNDKALVESVSNKVLDLHYDESQKIIDKFIIFLEEDLKL